MNNKSTEMRQFSGGATRNDDPNRLDYEGFLSPLVLRRYAQYLNKHREQADGVMRDSDNWQNGIPREVYMKSVFRHFMDMWAGHRQAWDVDMEESCCALLFNTMGYLFETLNRVDEKDPVLNGWSFNCGVVGCNEQASFYVRPLKMSLCFDHNEKRGD